MNRRDEEKIDLLINRAAEDKIIEMINKYPSPEELKGKVEFSKEHEQKMQEIIEKAQGIDKRKTAKKRTGRFIRFGRAAAAVFGLFFIIATLLAFTVPPLRIAIKNLIMTQNEDVTDIDIETNEEHQIMENYNVPLYVPDGFKLIETIKTDSLYLLTYTNEDKYIIFERFVGNTSLKENTQDVEVKDIKISNLNGLIYTNNDCTKVIFNNEEFTFRITSNLDKGVVIKIAESVVLR